MLIKKTVNLSKEEVQRILSKFIEKKIKSTVESVIECTDGSLEFIITPAPFDESGD